MPVMDGITATEQVSFNIKEDIRLSKKGRLYESNKSDNMFCV